MHAMLLNGAAALCVFLLSRLAVASPHPERIYAARPRASVEHWVEIEPSPPHHKMEIDVARVARRPLPGLASQAAAWALAGMRRRRPREG